MVGVASKPVIDLMIGVSDLGTTEALADRFTALGYEDCGGAEGRRYFRMRGGGQDFNVQLIERRSRSSKSCSGAPAQAPSSSRMGTGAEHAPPTQADDPPLEPIGSETGRQR